MISPNDPPSPPSACAALAELAARVARLERALAGEQKVNLVLQRGLLRAVAMDLALGNALIERLAPIEGGTRDQKWQEITHAHRVYIARKLQAVAEIDPATARSLDDRTHEEVVSDESRLPGEHGPSKVL